jgi:hypothetical protein
MLDTHYSSRPFSPEALNSHSSHRQYMQSPSSPYSVPEMCTLETVEQLVKDIATMSSTLSDAVTKGSKEDKIWSVMNSQEGEVPYETFNRRFDALFGEDCRDFHGRLHHVRQGKLGMGIVVSYLSKIDWSDFPLDLVELKLRCLVKELQHLQCVPKFVNYHILSYSS